ncbi:MAG: hypothetical protein RL213_378 [Bacteroidota bacterium]|jgi:nucleoid DNA-binding protein
MRPFDHHIHALLLDHDCVIVPDLGGFIAGREEAHIDAGRQMAVPPRRSVAFNVFLKQNDGLLARRIVDTEKVSYPEALQEIENYVSRCMAELGRGTGVEIRNVGRLTMDTANRLQFEPDTRSNLLPEAFGLPVITARPLHSGAPVGAAEKKQKLSSAKGPRKKRRDRTLVAAVLIAGVLAWFAVNVYLVGNGGAQKVETESPKKLAPEKVAIEPAPAPLPAGPSTVDSLVTTSPPPVVAETTVSTSEPKNTQPLAVESPVQPKVPLPLISGKGDFYVVCGVFRIRENAERFVAGLHAEGFPDAGVIDTSHRIFYVSYGRHETREAADAQNKLLKGRSKECWIYHRGGKR